MRNLLIACLFSLAPAASVFAAERLAPIVIGNGQTVTGKCVDVHDGDTVTLVVSTPDGKRQVKVRLNGIDAPEIGQPFGTRAKEELAGLAFGRECEVISHGGDRYGRTIGEISVGGHNANANMLEAGMAWHYTRYDHRERLADLEAEAKIGRRGLWSDKSPIPPWEWRKMPKAERAKLRESPTMEATKR